MEAGSFGCMNEIIRANDVEGYAKCDSRKLLSPKDCITTLEQVVGDGDAEGEWIADS